LKIKKCKCLEMNKKNERKILMEPKILKFFSVSTYIYACTVG
jgi:hypothetical protein